MWVFKRIVFVTAVVGLVFGVIQLLLRSPQVPYNARELFPGTHQDVSVVTFSCLLIWLGFGPSLVGELVAHRRRLFPFLAVWAAAIGLVSWGLLYVSVTRESLWDILGFPTMDWNGDWELLLRFLALQGIVTLVLLITNVSVCTIYRAGSREGTVTGTFALLAALPWLVLCWMVVVAWAGTDNLTELIRSTPGPWFGPVFLTMLMFLIAANASVLSHACAQQKPSILLLLTVAALALVVPGWGLLWLGLDPAVEKYGLVFPAVQFLLGPDRQTPLTLGQLALRWAAVQTGAVFLLTAGGCLALFCTPHTHRESSSGRCSRE